MGEKFLGNTYRFIIYTDVNGNAKDGYEINNQAELFSDLVITDAASDKDILEYLVNAKLIATSDRRMVRLLDDGEIMEVEFVKDSYPIGRFERVA